MLPRLVNLSKVTAEYAVDRSSPLGNPFHMKDESQRDAVCWLYEMYSDLVVREGQEPVDAVSQLIPIMQQYGIKQSTAWKKPTREQFLAGLKRASTAKTIGCWCSPKHCHGNIILNILGERGLPV